MSVKLGPLWHVGIVVVDLDAAVQEFSVAAGLRWSTTQEQDVEVETPAGIECGRVRWVASSGQSPDWEMIQQRDGGLWSVERNNGSALHHMAYWSDDLATDSAALEAAGFTREARGRDAEGRIRFEYLVSPSGIRIELGARYTEQAWNEWVSGGQYGLQF